jgi:hypothetical protein
MSIDKWASHGDIFKDKESLLKVWLDERRSRDVSAGLMWDNLKLFSVLIPAVITVDTLFLNFIYEDSMKEHTLELLWFSFAFPVMVILLSVSGNMDLFRRWNRTLEAIVHLNKLEKLLGLDEPLPQDKKVFEDDTHLFQRYHTETIGLKTEEEFIKKNRYKFNMFTSMAVVYWIFAAIGVLLLVYQAYLVYTGGE